MLFSMFILCYSALSINSFCLFPYIGLSTFVYMKVRYTLILCCISSLLFSQNMLNPSFDSVYFGGIDRVFQWITSDGIMMNAGTYNDTVQPLLPNTHYQAVGLQYSEILYMGQQTDTSSHSPVALKLMSHPEKVKLDGSTYKSSVANGTHFYTDSAGYVDFSRCGIPFPYRPTKLKGLYQFVDSTLIGMNFGRCVVLLKKWNASTHQSDTIAFTDSQTDFTPASSWQNFEIPILYRSTQMPDSLVVVFFANSRPDQQSVFWLDELNFDYTGFEIEELRHSENGNVFPNPSSTLISFLIDVPIVDMHIFNDAGALLYQGTFQNPVDISAFKPGVIFIQLQSKTGNFIHLKIVKSKE